MGKANDSGYLGHRPGSIRGRIHKEFDEKGLPAALALGEKIRRQTRSETPKESTVRSWVSHFKRTTNAKASQGFAEESRTYGGEPARRTARAGRKVSIPVELDEGLLMEAKAMDMNLSQLFEEELRERVKDLRGARWAEENKAFIDSYNVYIDRNGVFGEDLLDLDDPPV